MFIGLFLVTHRASLIISYRLDCSYDLTELLVVFNPDFVLSILSWSDPAKTVHIFAIMWVATIPVSNPISSNW